MEYKIQVEPNTAGGKAAYIYSNADIEDAAVKAGARVRFCSLYHVQFFFDDKPEWVYNWYHTTGTLNKQKLTNTYYRMEKVGVYAKTEDALSACV